MDVCAGAFLWAVPEPAPFSRLHQPRPCMTMMSVEGNLEKKERVEYTQNGQHENEYRGGPGTATIEPSPD